jgi:4-hydroxy-tetrahydrodipicolinate synthase
MAITRKDLFGSFPALVTPFTSDGTKIDFSSFEALLEVQKKAGVTGYVVCGSTGESATLTQEEYKKAIEFVVSFNKKEKPIIAGIGTSSTAVAAELGKLHRDIGVDATLVVTPPYNKPPQRGVIEHFRSIQKSSGLPLIAYNIPGRSALNVTPQTINILADEGLIIGVKESSGNMDQVLDLLALVEDKIAVLSGEDSLVHAMMASGGHGVISASQNAAPKQFADLCHANLKGDFISGKKIQAALLPLVRALFIETNPIPVKVALKLQGVIASDMVRLPLVHAEPSTIENLKKVL